MTVCVHEHQSLFGDILGGEMKLNEAGCVIERWWNKLAEKFPYVQLDSHVIMPNHLHVIIILVAVHLANLVGADPCVRPNMEPVRDSGAHAGSVAHIGATPQEIIQWFKTMTTNGYIRGVNKRGWRPFDKHLWQRSFYEHVVLRTNKLNRIRKYILNNPLRWEFDRENPQHENK